MCMKEMATAVCLAEVVKDNLKQDKALNLLIIRYKVMVWGECFDKKETVWDCLFGL